MYIYIIYIYIYHVLYVCVYMCVYTYIYIYIYMFKSAMFMVQYCPFSKLMFYPITN